MKTTVRVLMIIAVIAINAVYTVNAQVAINTDGSNPDASAMLDVKSADKGLLPPRVADVSAVSNPIAGLMVYDISNQCMRYYYGNSWSLCMGGEFTCGASTLADADGNTYPTVQIGTQCWMEEDLRVSHYPNGDAIPYIDDDATWGALLDNNTDDAYSFFGDSDNDGTVDIAHPDYGALYTYAAAIGDNWVRDNSTINSEGGQGICPEGWHLPTDAEWTTLTDYLGGLSVAGGKMKETGTTHWISPNTGADNSSGFTALPGGKRSNGGGAFGNITIYAYWWSSTEGPATAYTRYLVYNEAQAYRTSYYKSYGYSVRCVRD